MEWLLWVMVFPFVAGISYVAGATRLIREKQWFAGIVCGIGLMATVISGEKTITQLPILGLLPLGMFIFIILSLIFLYYAIFRKQTSPFVWLLIMSVLMIAYVNTASHNLNIIL